MRRKTIRSMLFALMLFSALTTLTKADPPEQLDPKLYGTVTLIWDAVIHPDLGGYKIWIGDRSGYPDGHQPGEPPEGVERDYSSFVSTDVQNVTTYTYAGLDKRTRYYFVATAYSVPMGDPPQVEESDFSNEVHTDWTDPSKVLVLRITGDSVTRSQMAKIAVQAKHGMSFVPPPATGTVFADVPTDYPLAAWIEQMYRDGITGGCSQTPLKFCPDKAVNRAMTAVFLLRVKHGGTYTPPTPTGIFADVDVNKWHALWAEQAYREGLMQPCGTDPLRFCPLKLETRPEVDRLFNVMF